MRRSARLRFATEIYIEMLREGNLRSWWNRQIPQQRYVSLAKRVFNRAGLRDSLPVRADKIIEKLIQAYGEVMNERASQRQKKNTVATVKLNNGNVRRIGLGTANNGRRVVVVNPSGNNNLRNNKHV